MKPIIIFTSEEKDGYVKIKKEEFVKTIEEAYLSGKNDGKTATFPAYPNIPTRNWEPTCRPLSETAQGLPISFVRVTCMGGD